MRRAAVLLAGVVGALAASCPLPTAAADEPQINASLAVAPERPAANDTIRLTYSFSGPGAGGSLRVPSSLVLKGVLVVGGPSTSTSVEMINFDVRRSVSVTYFLRPQWQGTAEIGEATFEIGGKPVKVPGRTLEIGPARAAPPPDQQQEEEDPFDRFFHRRAPSVPQQPSLARRGEPAVIEYLATPEKTTAYVGEEIPITYELVTQVDVDGLEPVEAPKYPGCWAEDIERPEHPQGVRGVHEGKPVMRFLLQKKAVSGLAPGVVTLPPARVRLAVRGGGDPFGDPFGFMRRQVVERATRPITLKILPIPGAAADFKGPIGKFDVTAKLDPPEVAAGSATTLKVRITGTGNLRTATDPPHVAVTGARLYPPTRAAEPPKTPGKATESVEWDYVIVPNAPGALVVPPIQLQVFDPAARRIVTKSTPPLTLAVEGTAVAAGSAPSAPGTAGNAVTEDQPLAAAAQKGGASRPTPTPSGPHAIDMANRTVTVPIWLLAAVPGGLLVLGTGAVLVRRRRRARSAILEAVVPEPNETKERAASRIERALRTLLASRGVPETVTSAQVPDAMRAAGEPEGRIAETKDLLEDLDFLRFAPQLGDYTERIAQARDRAARLLPKLR